MIEIDFKLLLAQIASFLVALFIVWRLFWGPLTRMMAKRRSDIAKEIEDASAGRQAAEKMKQEYQNQICAIEERAREMLERAAADGRATKEEIIRAAQEQARAFLAGAKEEIGIEKELAMARMRKETVDLAVLIAEKILKQSVDAPTRERMLNEFIDGLRNG